MGNTYTMEEEKDRTLPEDTIFKGVLADVNEKEIEWKDKQTGQPKSATLLEWWLEVIDDPREDGLYNGRKVKYECDARLTNHPRNGFRLMAEALLGRELSIGTPVDPWDDLIGCKVDFSVKHRRYTDRQGNERIGEDVDELMALSTDDVPF